MFAFFDLKFVDRGDREHDIIDINGVVVLDVLGKRINVIRIENDEIFQKSVRRSSRNAEVITFAVLVVRAVITFAAGLNGRKENPRSLAEIGRRLPEFRDLPDGGSARNNREFNRLFVARKNRYVLFRNKRAGKFDFNAVNPA